MTFDGRKRRFPAAVAPFTFPTAKIAYKRCRVWPEFPFLSFPRKALLTAAALLALAACGRRGDLEPPSAAVASPTPANGHGLDVHRANTKIAPPKKDFLLDPLLQ